MIFYRNPQIGKVKTRLAATVGNDKALDIFRKLSAHTKEVAMELKTDKIVFYSDSIDLMDMWPNATFLKTLQHGEDLGERMRNAFQQAFDNGYGSVCIIGTDCYELTSEIIDRAFASLTSSDTVIGPARDGGYYLLGMNRLHPQIFQGKAWSTGTVFRETIRDLEEAELAYKILPVLRDVDTADDVPEELM